jgi:hypothetical protein
MKTAKMIFVSLLILFRLAKSQITSNSGKIQINFFPKTTLVPFSNASSLYYPDDTLTTATFTPNHIYTLSSNNVVQIYDRQNASILQAIITD